MGCKPCYGTWTGCQINCFYPAGNTYLKCTRSAKSWRCWVYSYLCKKSTYCGGGSFIGNAGCKGCTNSIPKCLSLIKKGGC